MDNVLDELYYMQHEDIALHKEIYKIQTNYEKLLLENEFMKKQLIHIQHENSTLSSDDNSFVQEYDEDGFDDRDLMQYDNIFICSQIDDLQREKQDLLLKNQELLSANKQLTVKRNKSDLNRLLDEERQKNEFLERKISKLTTVQRHDNCKRIDCAQNNKVTIAESFAQTVQEENNDFKQNLAEDRRNLFKLESNYDRLHKIKTFDSEGFIKYDNVTSRRAVVDITSGRSNSTRSKRSITTTIENDSALNICLDYRQQECDDCKHLHTQNEELKKKNASIRQEKGSFRAEWNEFEREIQMQNYQMQRNEDSISNLKRQNEVVQSKYEQYLSSTKHELSSLHNEIRKKQVQMILLEYENDKLVQDSKAQISELMIDSKQETENMSFEIQRLNTALKNAQQTLYDSQLKMQKLERRIKQAEGELHRANEDINIERSRNAMFSKEKSQNNDTDVKLDVLNKELENEISRNAVLSQENTQYKETIRILPEALDSERSRKAILSNEMNHYKGKVLQMKASQFDIENDSALLRQEHKISEDLRNATEHNQQFEQQLSHLKTSGQAMVEKIDYLNNEIRQLSNVLEGKDSDISKLKFELQRKNQEIEDKVRENVATKEKNEKIQGLVSDLQTEICQYKSNLKDTSPDSDNLAVNNSNLRRKVGKYQRELKEARSEIGNASEKPRQMTQMYSDLQKTSEQALSESVHSLNEQTRELTMRKDSNINNLKVQYQPQFEKIENMMTEHSLIKEQNKTNEQLVIDLQIELDQYKSNMKDKDSDAVMMSNTILNLRREVEKYEIELNQTRDELKKATEGTLRMSEQAFIDEKVFFNDKIRELTNSLKRKDSDVRKMETEMAELSSIREKYIKCEQQVTELQIEVNKYKSDLNEKCSASDKMTNIISNLRREVETYQSELVQARDDLRNATRNVQQIERLNDKVRELSNVLQRKDNDIQKMETKLAELSSIKGENVKSERQVRDFQIKINQYESDLKDKSCDSTKQTDAISKLRHEMERCKTELKEAHEERRTLAFQLKTINNEHENCQNLISSLQKENKKFKSMSLYKGDQTKRSDATLSQREHELSIALEKSRRELREVQHDLDDTKTRLSKVMGQKLTDNNPNIADLSDKNRPTKLAERYSELYDNQWTDAFEVICKQLHDEKSTIESLNGILMNAAEFCREEARTQLEAIQRILLPQKTGSTFPSLVHKNLKDCRKALGELTGAAIYEKYIQDIDKQCQQSLQLDVKPYVKECVELCWLMSIQDPPVVVAPELQHGANFDTDFYKAYTKSGPLVDYVVWPALCLHEKGPLLCKGIAQGYGGKKTKY